MPEYADIDFDKLEYETDDAVLLVLGVEEVWIPKSLIYDDDICHEGGTVQVEEWFALKEGLI